MKNQKEKSEKNENIQMEPKEEISEASEENSENADQEDLPESKVNLASFITTPYERVLSIINEAKAFILSISKNQQELVKGLEWTIKVISSHSLYSYELKDQDYLNQVSEENPDFKQFVEFVNSYNDEVIQMNKKINIIGGKSFQKSSLNLKRVNTHYNEENEENDGKVKDTQKQNTEKKNQENSSNNNDKKKQTKGKDTFL